MNGCGKSDRPVLPARLPNKTEESVAEAVEERGLAKGKAVQQNTLRTQGRTNDVPNALDRIRQAAIRNKEEQFTALLHHITVERLQSAFYEIKRTAAAGVDGVTWHWYEEGLEDKLQELHGRIQRGAYRAKPSRRAYIPKSDGRQRPLGISSLEDKIVQRAVAEVLNAIYEVDFVGFSYGFRPGRKAHEALDALAIGIRRKNVNWVLDADIRGYFDSINHERLIKFIGRRISDRRILRLIKKWLKAGVIENDRVTTSDEGTPQGASISPILSNIYLHYVLDIWVQKWRKTEARGDVVIVRWADDFVMGFQYQDDAERFLKELHERFRQYELELHPEKTRLIRFGRFARQDCQRFDGKRKPETFDFLGFTHACGVRRDGQFIVKRKTMRKRFTAKLHEIKSELRKRMHESIGDLGSWLRSVVRGYFAYHAIPGNWKALGAFRIQIAKLWYKILRRRSQRNRMTWEHMRKVVDHWLPPAHILHPWPEQRFAAMTQGKSRVK
ncbi:MAG TPA: group II intron reverse transcriptase/maturase [Nitrospiraceae bacterium]|nr:group II intron reverse transcriptase/maturase [Nitrospiraceae bacterium]